MTQPRAFLPALLLAFLAMWPPAIGGGPAPQKPRVWSPELARPPEAGEEYANPTDGSTLVWIPGGEFLMGANDGQDDEKPQHKVRVEGFWLAKHEVTNAQYRAFLKVTRRTEPPYLDNPAFNEPDMPIIALTWQDAHAYCEWAKARLPTEAEWEYAATGGKQLKYPTATGAIGHDLANYGGVEGRDHWDGPSPVGSFPPNPFGLFDMAGNAWEWTSSHFMKYPYSPSDGREDASDTRALRVMRGGCWHFSAPYCTTHYRRRFASHLRYDYAGLRIALSKVEPPAKPAQKRPADATQ